MKNKFMRLAAIMLVLVLATSCFVGGTFAKYVTSGEGSDTARVAKFGVTVTGKSDSAFSKTYEIEDDESALSLAVESTEYVVAPGTKGELTAFTIEGTPEVAVKVDYVATVDFGDNWVDADGAYYCPIEITVGQDTLKGLDYTEITKFEEAVKAKIDGFTAEYEAGTTLEDADNGADAPAISWAWAFEGNDDDKDTDLGDAAADGTEIKISISITATVTQID